MRKLMLCLFFAFFICQTAFAAEAETSQPKVAALGAVLMDYKTGRVLWEKNSNEPMAMASTTKIMTAIIALEKGNLDDIVTISKRAAAAPEVNMNLSPGEKLTLRDLLYALMLQSYNDTAIAIAEHISGSVEAFCEEMTQRAAELGALDTVFETPNGLDLNDHHSTAYDMALITCYALGNEKFIEIINTPAKTVNSDKTWYNLQNKNRLLNEYDGANGVKTGFTGKAGQCFVGSAKRGDMQLISVVLASGWGDAGKEQKWVDTKELLNYGFDNYKYVELLTEGNACSTINVTRTKTPEIDIVFESGLTLPLSVDEIGKIKFEYDYPHTVKAPVESGQVMGTCKISLENDFEATINLLAAESAQRHDFATSLKKVLKGWAELGTCDDIKMESFDFLG